MSYWDLQYQELIKDVQSLVDQLRNLDEDRRLNNEYRCVIDFDVDQLKEKIYTFLNENREASNQVKVCKTLKSIRNAVECLKKAVAGRESIGRSLTHLAQNLLVSCQHCFEDISRSAVKFNKNFKDFERRQELLRTEDMQQHHTIHLDGKYQMKDVNSVAGLMDIGKVLDNCVKEYEEACDRMGGVAAGVAKIYVVEKDGAPVYLLQFDMDNREITDFSAKDDDRDNLVISYELAMEILIKLDVSGDEIPEFIRVGAFSKFKNGRSKPDSFVNKGQEMWKWRIQDELIIAVDKNSDGDLRWSRFKLPFRNRCWSRRDSFRQYESHHYELGVEELLDLIFQNPDLLGYLLEPTIDQVNDMEISENLLSG